MKEKIEQKQNKITMSMEIKTALKSESFFFFPEFSFNDNRMLHSSGINSI